MVFKGLFGCSSSWLQICNKMPLTFTKQKYVPHQLETSLLLKDEIWLK